jgi:predicted DNA-binding transcriptional regulator AlpA
VTGLTGHFALRKTLTQSENQLAETAARAFTPLLSDKGLADILIMTTPWVRSHADKIPGFIRLGSYFRFCNQTVEQWLGSLERLFEAGQVSALLGVPESWVYANADDIPGVLRLGRYVRFRPATIRLLLGGVEVVQ